MRRFWLLTLLSMPASAVFASDGPCTACGAPALAIEGVYTGEVWRNAAGGAGVGDRYLDNLDVTLEADGGQLFGLDGLKFFAYALYDNGQSIAELSNAAQGTSNIEATRALRLYELWSEWQFGAGDSSLRLGLYDLNSEFDSIETAGLFINPSHGIGPDFSQSGANGPSIFPVTSLALRAMTSIDRWTLQAAILDGVPGDVDRPDRPGIHLSRREGALLVGEIGYRAPSGVRLGAGYWQYTAEFDALRDTDGDASAEQLRGNAGLYVFAESATLFAQDQDRGLRLFARTGFADDDINPVHRYYGGGAVYTGWAERRPEDQVGLSVAIAELGDPIRDAQQLAGVGLLAREYVYEATYRCPVSDWLTLQSDVQYVRHPSMDPTLDAAWVVGLRFEIGHRWTW